MAASSDDDERLAEAEALDKAYAEAAEFDDRWHVTMTTGYCLAGRHEECVPLICDCDCHEHEDEIALLRKAALDHRGMP